MPAGVVAGMSPGTAVGASPQAAAIARKPAVIAKISDRVQVTGLAGRWALKILPRFRYRGRQINGFVSPKAMVSQGRLIHKKNAPSEVPAAVHQ